ncbi:regulator [Microbacterium sp. STN6]|uniref:AAA family ATPase n=1 Tax=Microbacterium sp. STN6 TaxID=2995588 RepID=UPI002260E446|nr:regulator [Microbacterium sp. STN6]MCX7521095.1 regulator [Microbacterium sp. STN6]
MARLALALDRRTEDRLIGDALNAGHQLASRPQTGMELVALAGDGVLDAAVVSASRRWLTPALMAACDAGAVRLVALAAGEQERRNAASLGLYEVLDATSEWAAVEELLTAVAPAPAPARQSAAEAVAGGRVIAVWGPAGAPGRTTLATTIAAEIAARGHSVALADVDTYGGCIAPSLGLLDEAPGFAAACRLAGSGGLNRGELERVASRYASSKGPFWVLTGIGRPTRWPELSAERVAATIETCRGWVDYLVIDTGFSLESDEEISSDLFAPRRNAATLAALRAADHIVEVGLADPVGMPRFLRAHVDLAELVPDTPSTVVMNRVRATAVGMAPFAQVSSTLARFAGITAPVLVPHDQQGVDTALLTGKTLADAAPRSPARAAVSRMVESALLPRAEAGVAPRRRLLGRRAGAASVST